LLSRLMVQLNHIVLLTSRPAAKLLAG
jgi:hypothetical protein